MSSETIQTLYCSNITSCLNSFFKRRCNNYIAYCKKIKRKSNIFSTIVVSELKEQQLNEIIIIVLTDFDNDNPFLDPREYLTESHFKNFTEVFLYNYILDSWHKIKGSKLLQNNFKKSKILTLDLSECVKWRNFDWIF
jgi:hypothetical protein